MSELLAFAKRLQSFDAIAILNQVVSSKESKEFLINLITQEQLFDKGINSEGIKLSSIGGNYSPRTILGVKGQFEGKLAKGLPIDRITLFDEGDFYDSFRIEVNLPFIFIIFDDLKEGVHLTDRWGNDIAGLTDESKEKYEEFLLGKVFKIILQNLLS